MTDSSPRCLRPQGGSSSRDLPVPGPELQSHSLQLVDRIREAIAAHEGVIDFRRYMEMVLYEPGLGYYSGGLNKLGREGDFVTAPEVSSLFSGALALQVAEVLASLDGGDCLEFGGGSGAMAADVLLELERQGQLPGEYAILEISAELRDRQRKTLEARAGHLMDRVRWLDALPTGFRGVVLGNEVLDAMPVRRFRIRDGEPRALGVGWDEAGRFVERETAADSEMRASVAHIQSLNRVELPEGYESEYNPNLPGWFAALGESLEAGAIFLLDYGHPGPEYYAPERSMGTLICHYRHRVHDDPFVYPGLQDITANVDFTAVTEAAVNAGLALAGYTSQANFLLGCGLSGLAESAMAEADTETQFALAGELKVLTMPNEMGERFKAIAFAKGEIPPLRGFSLRDFSGQL